MVFLVYALGFAREYNAEDQVTHSASAEMTWSIKKNIEAFLNYELSQAPTYDSEMVKIGFRLRF